MRILGIDPGLATMGYGVVDLCASKLKMVDFGAVYTDASLQLPERLNMIFEGVTQLIECFNPDTIAIEELFFNKNVKTALTVGHARGVAIAAAYRKNKELFEYTPLQIKQSVVGYGRAEKEQVQMMVKTILSLNCIPKPDDAADALAVSICHAHSFKFKAEFKIV
ncbi:MAG: crossover junction endodeoxyribonuclease RuvC [Eubacteriales bacterium]